MKAVALIIVDKEERKNSLKVSDTNIYQAMRPVNGAVNAVRQAAKYLNTIRHLLPQDKKDVGKILITTERNLQTYINAGYQIIRWEDRPNA